MRLPLARRGLAGSARALAVVLLALTSALVLPATAEAQSAGVLVSNIGENQEDVGAGMNDKYLLAQSFSVPSSGGNYTLTSIEMLIDTDISSTNIGSLGVSVWSADASFNPDSSLHTLTNPASVAADVAASFTAPAGATLEAGNTYFVVAYNDRDLFIGPAWEGTNSDDQDATSITGWTIANNGLRRAPADTSWSGRTYAFTLRVNGTAVGGGTPSSDATLSALTVTAAGTDLVTFASGTTDYTPMVANDVEEVTVTAMTTDSGAMIEYLDVSDMTLDDVDTGVDGHQVTLAVGETVIKVKVTAEDGNATQTYKVTVTRAAAMTPTGICDRTQQVREYIVAVLSGVDDCAAVTVADLAGYSYSLELNGAGLTLLKAGDFAGLTSLSNLFLDLNSLTTLPDGVFSDLTALVTLRLNENALSTLDAGVFSGLTALHTLNLTDNKLASLPRTVFSGLTSLQSLTLNENVLSTLDAGVFSGLTAMHTLNLNDNQLTMLPAGVFSGLTALRTLTLTGNDLSLLPGTVFSGPTALESLQLGKNQLTMLPAGVFSGLTALQTLNLSNNILASLPEELFSGLTGLTVLRLNDNALTALRDGVFSDLTGLIGLFLNNNALTALPDGVFSGLASLSTLDLGDNALESLRDGVFSDLTALARLYLDDNALESLRDGVFSGLTALTHLTLGGNSTNPMELTVTVEKVGTNQVRAKVLAGAPFAVDIPVTLVDGTLEGSVTVLGVAAGAVDGAPLTVTRTSGTTTAVTVDVDLTTQPTLSSNHSGYTFKKATTNLPATILPAAGASTDATLSALVVNDGTTDLTLTPTFASSKYTYTAMVANTVTEVTVTPTKNDSGATIEYLDEDDAPLTDADTGVTGQQVVVVEGDNVIKVKVTAEDGNATQTYTVTVKRAAAADAGATLRALVVNDGRRDLTLRPGFAPGTTSYRVWVVNDVAEVTVTATPNDAEAMIEYLDGSDVTLTDAGTDAGHQVAVAEGDTVVKVKVTAKDGNTTRTYTVTVTRRAVDAPGVEGDLRLTDEELYTHPDGHEGVSGRAEIFHAERWGTVSSDGFSKKTTFRFAPDLDADGEPTGTFTETEPANEAPALFCQVLSYDTGEYAPGYGRPEVPSQRSEPEMPYYPMGSTYPPDGPEPIWLDDLTCAAGDDDLTVGALPVPLAHCGFAGWGLHNSNHGEDAGVRCWNVEDSAMAGARALKARFVSPPEHHDGSGRVKVRVAFSEAIEESPENVGEHGVKVEGGRVTSVRQVDNQPAGGAAGRSAGRSGGGQEDGQEDGERVWEFEIEPGSDDDLTMRIDAGRSCDEPGAICTADGRSLSEGIATTVEGPDPVPLTAAFEGLPEAHDGEDTFHFRVAFSEDIGIGFRSMRDESFTVDGGEVTGARRVDRRHDLWQITVAPDGEGEVTVTLAAGRACAVSGAICTRGGDRRQLTNTATATVAGPVDEAAPAVLTASFVEAPYEHDGETAFTLRIAFSEGISIGFRTFRDQSVSVSGGSVKNAKRVDRRKDLWKVTVKPGSRGDVTVTLAGGRACGTAGAVCTGDGRALSAGISTTVLGPAALTVADARAKEGTDETIDFTVSLSRATRAAVTVAYATADGTATAGSDYTATSGTLTFAVGETEQTVLVPVLDDAHDEGEETLTLRLTNATGAVIADGEATGTIKNTDPLQRAWLARFGRTAATHVTDAVGERLRAGSGASHVTVGGYRLPLEKRATGTAKPGGATTEPETTTDRLASLLTGLAGMLGLGAGQTGGPGAEPGGGGPGWDAWPDAGRDPRLGQSHGVTLDLRRLLLGSSFRLNLGAAATGSAGPRLTAWGRVAGTTFDGRDGKVSLNGDVLTGTVGVDGAWDRLLAGLAVAHSRGDGSFTKPGTADRGRGELETTLTSIHPYLRYAVNDRLDMWGVLGYGRGHMEMAVATGETLETDMALVMGAFGGRGILLPAGETGGFELATRTDAMLTRTSSDAVAGMVSADAEAHRLRLVLEGSRGFAWAEGRSLTPTMEVGLRHDWGDAETGFGLELGGRVHYADTALGLTIEAAVRGLLAHEDDDYQEWGASGSLRLAPGAGGQGLALTLAPTWGAASSGVNGLWSRQTTAGLAPQGNRQTPAGRLNAEVGYGVAAPFGTGLLTPYAGTVLSDGAARTYRVGTRLQLTGGWATGLTLNLEGTRQDPAGQQPLNQGLRLQVTWGF